MAISTILLSADARAQQMVSYQDLGQAEFEAMTETTIIASDDSATGYFVTFRYLDDSAEQVQIRGEWNFTDEQHATIFTTANYGPDQWFDGVFVNGPWPTTAMEKNSKGIWTYTIPLPSGTFSYHFIVDGEKTLDASASAYADGWAREDLAMSQVYVPFDSRYQTLDRSVEMPRAGADRGRVEYVRFPSAGGREDPLGIYLPPGYNADRTEPYRLLVLVHGGSGNYTDWFNQGAAVNILDNLIAEGSVDPLVVVSVMNSGDIFTQEVAEKYLLPFLQGQYRVSRDPQDLALAGLSRGGFLTSRLLFANPGAYQHYLIMSSGILTEDRYGFTAPLDKDWDYSEANLAIVRNRDILVSIGLQDHLFPYVVEMHKRFAEHEIPFTNVFVKGGHQWDNWRQVLTFALTNFLWQ